jgi:hypothetical protein
MNFNSKRNLLFLWHLLLTCSVLPLYVLGQKVDGQPGRGVVVIMGKKDPARFLDPQGNVLSQEKMKVGMVLPEGYVAHAGINGEIVLLLSNGTVTTLESQTKLKIREFTQEPFDAAGRKVSDLKAEPSKSNVKLDLDWGSIVVTTKKLNRESSLNIHSPSGVAGIRGTQFRMSDMPGVGIKLDVTESTVSFTPKGAVRPIPVGPGQGLDVSAIGVVRPRPATPVAVQAISETNAEAVVVTGEVSLQSVAEAMVDEFSESSEREELKGGESSIDTIPPTEDESDGAAEEAKPSTILPEEPESTGDVPDASSVPPESDSAVPVSVDEKRVESQGGGPAPHDSGILTPGELPVSSSVDSVVVLENNSDAKQARKTGTVNVLSRQVSHLGLSDEQLIRLHGFSMEIQRALIGAGVEISKRLLDLPGLQQSDLSTFFAYSGSGRNRVLSIADDKLLRGFLAKNYDESWLSIILSEDTLLATNPNSFPDHKPQAQDDERVLDLADKLKDSGNAEILNELLKEGQVLTPELARVAEVANQLLADFVVPGMIESKLLLGGEEVLANPFYAEVASVYGYLESESLIAGEASFLGGRNIELTSEPYFVMDAIELNTETLVFSASENIKLSGDIMFDEISSSDHPRVVLMSGGSFEAASGLSLDAVINDLVLSARGDLSLQSAYLAAEREVSVIGMRDLNLNDVQVNASRLTTLKAAKDLYVDSLRFNQNLPKIVMEATTIRLRNIDFPAAAQVNLNSLKGPIDGRYPNFGTSVPAARQLGRVNFLHNVKAGGNAMFDRATFDQFGSKISIGKLK